MDKVALISVIWEKFKLVRVERNYTQEEMAEILGISKKTLVQIEKGRISPGWTTTIALCAIFRNSEILQNTLGGDPLELLEIVSHTSELRPKEWTLGGKIWWTDILEIGSFRLQQNMITQHYRILDDKYRRWYSTFDLDIAKMRLEILTKAEKS